MAQRTTGRARRRPRRLHHGVAVVVPRGRPRSARRLEAAGFTRLDETEAGRRGRGPRRAVLSCATARCSPGRCRRRAGPTTPYRIVGAHTDSPGFKLKPRPTTGAHGWLQAGVEVYGGPLLNSWLDRELELAGRLVTRDGTEHLVRTGPFLRIPQLAIHLDRQVNDGLVLDPQRHLLPVWGVGDADRRPTCSATWPGSPGVAAADVAGYDVLTADTAPPARFGLRRRAVRRRPAGQPGVGARRRCARCSPPPARPTGHVSVLAAFDHEELGSASRSGASGPLLADVLTRIGAGLGADRGPASPGDRRRRGACRPTPGTPCTRTTRSGTTPRTGRCPAAGRC